MKPDDRRPVNDSAVLPAREKPSEAIESLRGRLRALPIPDVIRRLARDRSVRAALFAFTLSRLTVLLIFVLIGLLKTAPGSFPGHYDAYVSLDKAPIARVLRQEVLTADVNWYIGIAE